MGKINKKKVLLEEKMHIFLNFSKKCHILVYMTNDADADAAAFVADFTF